MDVDFKYLSATWKLIVKVENIQSDDNILEKNVVSKT